TRSTYSSWSRRASGRAHQVMFVQVHGGGSSTTAYRTAPPYCDLEIFQEWQGALPTVRAELHDADIAVVGSYFQDGIAALDEVLESAVAVKAFYDIDTPVTVGRLRGCGATEYLLARRIPEVDVYFSFTAGPLPPSLQTPLPP